MARRNQARRKQKRPISWHWLKPLLALGSVSISVLGIALLWQWMQDAQTWPLNRVQVQGEFVHLPETDIHKVVEPFVARGFFVVDVEHISESIAALPWVDRVSVRRVWPDRLDIRVVEQVPVARWGDDAYLNVRAEVFEPQVLADIGGLPVLHGPDGHESRVLQMHAQLQSLVQTLRLDVDRLRLDERRAWHVSLSNGLRLETGRADPAQRVERFVTVYPAILAAGNGQVLAVDLRYSNGFAVRWQPFDKDAGQPG